MAGDYPEGRGRIVVEAAGIPIEGVSIAGHESFYKLQSLRALLEVGRAPEDVLGFSTVCITHGHLDHAAGLAHFASRRLLGDLPPPRVLVPAPARPDFEAWLAASERLEKVRYGLDLCPVEPGDRVPLRNDLELVVLPGRHRVATVGYLFIEVRRKLREEYAGRPGGEIAALRKRGVEVLRREEIPLLAYPGDCGVEIFEAAPEILRARVLLLECSFLDPEDMERARTYQHIHLSDVIERAGEFRNEAVVLTHFSLRYRPQEIRDALRAIPDVLAPRVIPFLT
jgi:ribonuclease Z